MADYRSEARRAAQRYGLDANVFLRQIKQESGFNPNARSPAGAIGIAQFMPGTAAGLGINPRNPTQALNGAAKLMAGYVRKYGSYRNALIAYNAGPGAVGRGSLPAETQNYIKTILGGREPGRPASPRSGGGSQASAASVGTTTSRTRTTTTTTPGVDNRVARAALISSFLEDHNADPVNFAVQANALKDVAPTSSTRTVRLPGSTSVRTSAGTSGTSAQSFGAGRGNAGRRGPVAHMTSEGGPHPTAGLAGFPARDYFAHPGTAAVAPINGKVVRLSGHDPAQGPTQGPHGPLGYSVYIQGDDGHTYFLTHMGSRNVRPGQRVRAGQKIGTVANYDKYGTPSHIHMGVD